jgi:hypothetical protein
MTCQAAIARLKELKVQTLEDLVLIVEAKYDRHEAAMQPVMSHLVGISRKGVKKKLAQMREICAALHAAEEQPAQEPAVAEAA